MDLPIRYRFLSHKKYIILYTYMSTKSFVKKVAFSFAMKEVMACRDFKKYDDFEIFLG